ncbi:MAG: glutathione peroxidase [Spirochaetales bacterium]|nr:glutathione peroxidase [Spirochaetales bacterium]
MNSKAFSGLLFLASVLPVSGQSDIYSIEVEDIEGRRTTLDEYRGKVLLIVNVASKCGYTYQYDGLQALYEKYADDGLVILGFPSNDFLGQEPGSNEEIQQFCRVNYGVNFPMFTKLSVKGRHIHPLYRFLTSKSTNPKFSGRITWNFNKFLVSASGEIIDRFGTREEPDSERLIKAIENQLAAR